MGGIKQEQSDAFQQPKPPHSADQRQDEVGTDTSDQDQQDLWLSFRAGPARFATIDRPDSDLLTRHPVYYRAKIVLNIIARMQIRAGLSFLLLCTLSCL